MLIDLVEENALNSTTERNKNDKAEPASKQEPGKKQKKLFDQRIFRDWCKSCGLCVAFCPKQVIGRDTTGAPVIEKPDACIGCRFCELHCPDFAITIKEREKESRRNAA